jgi:UrcA family protein
MITRFVPMIALTVGIALASTPALAGGVEKVNADVRYGDLNLTSEQGAATLHRRIAAAAAKVCGRPDRRDIKAAQAADACRADAIAAATPGVELAIANARNGQSYAANQTSLTVTGR